MPTFRIERTEVFIVDAVDATEAQLILDEAYDDLDYFSHTEGCYIEPIYEAQEAS